MKIKMVIPLLATMAAFAQTTALNTIQGDVLGESLEQYQKNNKCTLRAHMSGVEGTQACSMSDAHYAGSPMNVKGASFYQGKLFRVSFAGTTGDCQYGGVLTSITKRYGAASYVQAPPPLILGDEVIKQEGHTLVWRKENLKIEYTQLFGQCLIDFSSADVAAKVNKLQQRAEEVEKLRQQKEKEKDQ